MAFVGSDTDQLRGLAREFDRSVDALNSASKALNAMASDVSRWKGRDADRFRSEWSGASLPAVTRAIRELRVVADLIRRQATEQDDASTDVGRSGTGASSECTGPSRPAPQGLSGLWDQVSNVSREDDSAGYRVQRVAGADGMERYVVYIGGTDSAEGQTRASNVAAASGYPDDKQLAALRRIIPDGAEVMLVGYSQGGMDAQNIAAQKGNGFKVIQLVTFGSPVRPDLNVPAVHLQANGDGIPYSASINPFGPYLTNSTGSNPEARIYHGASDVRGTSAQIHTNAYSGLAYKWDQAGFAAASGVSRFQGTATITSDIDVYGNVM